MFIPQQPQFRTCPDCFRSQRETNPGRWDEPRTAREATGLPTGYLSHGYFNERDFVHGELVTSMAEEVAKRLGVGGITSTQLRRFYSKAKTVEQRLDANEPFEGVVPSILELKQHAANTVGRAQGRDAQAGLELLKQFIDRNVDLAVRSEKAFRKAFLLHFQGVVAYFKYHNPRK
jgi:CRISPR type III-A-associated protein Csm2